MDGECAYFRRQEQINKGASMVNITMDSPVPNILKEKTIIKEKVWYEVTHCT